MSSKRPTKAECYFINNNKDVWLRGSIHFIRNRIMKLAYRTDDGSSILTEIDRGTFLMETMFVGRDVEKVNGTREWKPTDRTPGVDGEKCPIETFSAFANKNSLFPAFWLQFPSITEFCTFYENWRDNLPQYHDKHDPYFVNSVEYYEEMKKRLPEPKSNPTANMQFH